MPSFAKLIAALCLGALGYVLSEMIRPLPAFEEDFNFGYFNVVNMAVGAFIGWTWIGQRAGRGTVMAINNGISGLALMVFFGLMIQGGNEMLRLALRNRYDTAFESLIAMVELSLEYFFIMSTVPIWSVALAGGIFAALMSEQMVKRKR